LRSDLAKILKKQKNEQIASVLFFDLPINILKGEFNEKHKRFNCKLL